MKKTGNYAVYNRKDASPKLMLVLKILSYERKNGMYRARIITSNEPLFRIGANFPFMSSSINNFFKIVKTKEEVIAMIV